MKKIFLAMAALALTVVACDPSHDNEGPDASVTSEELSDGLQITAKSDGNNNLTICTSPSRYIQVFDASDGTMLGQGTNVKVQVVPPAGERSFYVETKNWDGSVVKSAPKSITVSEFTDLPKIYSDIFGDGNGGYTTCTWTWDTEASDGVWGNGAFLEHSGPGWWVVHANEIDEQATGKDLPKDGLDGWFSLDLAKGVNTSRGETGRVSVNEDVVKAGWDIGTMNFSGTIPLMGIMVNVGNQRQYSYHILKADANNLRLCAEEPGAGDWGTAFFWNFKKIPNK